ncbi:MAG: cyclic nucleotide-binding domain-containing protein [Defluviitaleaceae bacterium]|nr:cyclic nucleotide-binding domain-containing protein [Defluviitaleaceae bacterium]
MATTDFAQNSIICSKGEQLRHLLIITKGTVEAAFSGHVFKYEQGDMIGLESLSSGEHSLTYTATSDISLFTLPYDDISTLEALFREKEDIANVLVNSACRQAAMFLQHYAALKHEADKSYEIVKKVHPLYEKLCNLYAVTAKKLPLLDTVVAPSDTDPMETWVCDYYQGIKELEPAVQKAFFANPGISLGFIQRGADDMFRTLDACRNYLKYLEGISKIMLSSTGHDLFAIIAELHYASVSIRGADEAVNTIMSPLAAQLSHMTFIDPAFFKQRLSSYQATLTENRGGRVPSAAGTASATGEKVNLADSLSVIMAYSGYPAEQANKFIRLVQEFIKVPDRSSSDDSVHRMRRELTNMFNEVYKKVFMNSLADPALPTIIKMFLNFGYMDAALAGFENADYLYSIADSVSGDPERGIYTAQEWLTAIYTGKKEPCRNEFDQDYPAYVAELKQQKRFDAKEEARLLADNELKLLFEIDNIFPVVNKLTFGRITTFCPILSDSNIQRGLENSLVTPDAIREAFAEIKTVDYSAFFRETSYSNPEIGINRETVNVEIMPEVILMPNVGVRGIMWQDIEGRKRTTPSRMFAPLFLLVDLKPLLVRLTGEFRWEMCKRIQGSRWQDITEASLTSEYCDYLQFYRSNRDLSSELKVQVKAELTRARNNYKNVFVSNYSDWIMHEANGSPRLNRYARRLMMMYCTFAKDIRDGLAQNPQYAEPLKRFNFKHQQREHYLSRVIQKLQQTNVAVPQELLDEMEFIKM